MALYEQACREISRTYWKWILISVFSSLPYHNLILRICDQLFWYRDQKKNVAY
jgi:hypothetical protein